MNLLSSNAPAESVERASSLFRESFVASHPGDRVSGASIQAFVRAYGYFRSQALQILASHGIEEPDADQWYPFQSYLDALSEVYRKIGPNTLARVGRKLVEGANLPPSLQGVHVALAGLNDDYLARHRCSDAGGFAYTVVDGSCGIMLVRNPYPCELDEAVVGALAQRMQPKGAVLARVRHLPGKCRKDGALACALEVMF